MIYAIIIVIIIAILLYFETTTLIIAGFILGIVLAYFRAKRTTDLFLFFDRKKHSDAYKNYYTLEEVAEMKKICKERGW